MARAAAKKATPKKATASKKKKSAEIIPLPVKNKRVKESQKLPKSPKQVPVEAKIIELPPNPRAAVAQFYVKRIHEIEAKTHLVSNVAKYCDPLSSGYLCIDWLFNGGFYNGFASVAGQEQSGKSTAINHTIASGIKSQLLFNSLIDAEGTMNDEYATAMFEMMGINYPLLNDMPHKPYRYYKDNIIETTFDYLHAVLRAMPQKVWIPSLSSWAYIFDKRDKNEEAKMAAYGVKPERSLSRNDKFVCLTDYAGLEAAFYIDSFAAMVSEGDDDEDQKSKRRAVEASAFSDNLRRISARLSNRGALLFGANQMRKTPNVVGRQDPYYEPGGEALKFYSAQRARFASVASNFPGLAAEYHKDFKQIAEPSVILPGSYDFYAYKRITNTKNKMGNPKKTTWVRAWVADHGGNGHGFDPAFDVFNFLLETGQLNKDKRKLSFNLRKSVGSKLASTLNALPVFSELDLKALVLSEVFPSRELTDKALKGMHLSKKINLRESLFAQLRSDKSLLALKTSTKKKEVDYEDDGDSAQEY